MNTKSTSTHSGSQHIHAGQQTGEDEQRLSVNTNGNQTGTLVTMWKNGARDHAGLASPFGAARIPSNPLNEF